MLVLIKGKKFRLLYAEIFSYGIFTFHSLHSEDKKIALNQVKISVQTSEKN